MKEIGMRTLYFACALMLVALTAQQPAGAIDQDTQVASLPSRNATSMRLPWTPFVVNATPPPTDVLPG